MANERGARVKGTSADVRRVVKDWAAISAMAIADTGKAFASDNGSYRVCCWDASGALAWERALAKVGKDGLYNYALSLQLVGKELLAHGAYTPTIYVLDPSTGKTRRELAVPKDTRSFAVSPDGNKLVLRVSTETVVLSYPKLAELAMFDHYCNHDAISISADLRWLVVNGHEIHVYDLARLKHVVTFEPPESPWTMCFTSDHKLLAGDDTGRIRIYDPGTAKKLADADGAPERKRQRTITAVATSKGHIATARDDGTVTLLDRKLSLVRTFDKHHVTQPDTGATALGALAFSPDGKQLWVSAGQKNQPIGLSVYNL